MKNVSSPNDGPSEIRKLSQNSSRVYSLPVDGPRSSSLTPLHIFNSPKQNVLHGALRNSKQNLDLRPGSASIVSERVEYHERQVPQRVVKEKKVRKKMKVPAQEEQEIHEKKVIQIKEKIIEVQHNTSPEVVYNEIVEERKVKKQEVIEKIVPEIEYREKIVEGPEIEYIEVPVEKYVEVPQYEESIVYEEIEIPQYVDKMCPQRYDVFEPVEVHRKIPKPMEAVTEYDFNLPNLKPKYKRKVLPIYAPRFIEVPVPAELMDGDSQQTALHLREQIHLLAAQEAPCLGEVQKIADFAMNADFQAHISCTNYQLAIENAWRNKQLTLKNGNLEATRHVPSTTQVYGQPM